MDRPDAEALREQIEAEAAALFERYARPQSEAELIAQAADLYRRHGWPVTNGRFEGESIVFDVVLPRGQG